jgi:hypothetical protein
VERPGAFFELANRRRVPLTFQPERHPPTFNRACAEFVAEDTERPRWAMPANDPIAKAEGPSTWPLET